MSGSDLEHRLHLVALPDDFPEVSATSVSHGLVIRGEVKVNVAAGLSRALGAMS
jgi:hypothetical protein